MTNIMVKVKERGKFFVIEGPDGSGKSVQQQLLIAKLREKGRDVLAKDFPQYGEFFGRMVGKMLAGEYGPMANIHPEIASLVYASDRWKASSEIGVALRKGMDVVANRYTLSNMAHQSARLPQEERLGFINFLAELEYSNRGFAIPEPQLYVYLRVPQEVTWELVNKKAEREYLEGRRRDELEADAQHQWEASQMYEYLAQNLKGITTVECGDGQGGILAPGIINEMVWREARRLIDPEIFVEGQIRRERE